MIETLVVSILTGQLVKIPVFGSSGIILLDLTVAFLCLWGLKNLKFRLKRLAKQIIIPYLFLLAGVMSLILTPLHLTPLEYLISASYGIRFFIYVLLGWIVYLGGLPKLRFNISKVFRLSVIGLSIFGLFQFIFLPNLAFLESEGWDPHYFRTASTFLDPNFLGVFLTLAFIPFLTDNLKLKKKIFIPILIFLAILTTFSRSSYLMFLVAGVSLALLKKSLKLAGITLVIFIIFILGFTVYTNVVAKPRNIDRTQSASFRLNTWQQGLTISSQLPSQVLGVGFNAYRFAIEKYNLGNEQFSKSKGSTYNDSSLISVLVTTGFFGLAVYIVWLSFLFLDGTRSEQGKIFSASLLGLIVASFFNNTLFYPPILLWIILSSVDSVGIEPTTSSM